MVRLGNCANVRVRVQKLIDGLALHYTTCILPRAALAFFAALLENRFDDSS